MKMKNKENKMVNMEKMVNMVKMVGQTRKIGTKPVYGNIND